MPIQIIAECFNENFNVIYKNQMNYLTRLDKYTDRIRFPLVSRFMKRVLSHRCYTNTRIMKSDRFLVYTEINLLFQFMKLETSSTSK